MHTETLGRLRVLRPSVSRCSHGKSCFAPLHSDCLKSCLEFIQALALHPHLLEMAELESVTSIIFQHVPRHDAYGVVSWQTVELVFKAVNIGVEELVLRLEFYLLLIAKKKWFTSDRL